MENVIEIENKIPEQPEAPAPDKKKLDPVKREKIKRIVVLLAPIIGLGLLVLAYIILGTINDIRFDKGIQAIINSAVVCAVVATGATFIYALGSFDISLGAATLVSALLGAMAYNASGSLFVMILVCILVGVGVELVSSALASFLNLPVFITTVAMMSILGALAMLIINANGTGGFVQIPAGAVSTLDALWFRLLILGLYLVFAIFMFNFTKIGRQQKFLGGNPFCAKLSGVSIKKMAIVAFVLCGIGIGLGATLTITYAPTISRTTAGSLGMNVILAIVFGGMPVSGGSRSKIYAAVIGSFTITLLDQIMVMTQLGSGVGQVVKAVLFLAVVVVTSLSYRTKMLAR